jgi:hypothetical protein
MNGSIVGPTRRGPATADSQGVNVSGIVSPQLRARAIELAERDHTSLSRVVAAALEEYVKEHAA